VVGYSDLSTCFLVVLGALEKYRKKKTMALKVPPGKRKLLWELWKKP
jgi:hypothetical protein